MGDFSAHFHRPSSGIHTVEGNVAGARAAALSNKRQRDQEAFDRKQDQIRHHSQQHSIKQHSDKFQQHSALSASEQEFRARTVGLVTAEEFRRASEQQQKGGSSSCSSKDNNLKQQEISNEERLKQEKLERQEKKRCRKEKKKQMSALSFAHEEEELFQEDDDVNHKTNQKKSWKDPAVDTSFLPDKQREERQVEERRRLEQEWKEKQLATKQETLEIVYSYWDGSGHRRKVQCRKGDTIGDFLELVRKELAREFREMQSVSSDALLYVKEDLILPHDLTFYDLIATKARGKSGPLFHFDVHEDVRIGAIDSRVEKDESHPGKVVERRWYDRNKHIFPASRWEVFDPAKDYGTYTIHGGEVQSKKK